MPWTAKDAEKHTKKADTDKKRRQWASVANSALESCMKEGKSQKDCEASAIRQANSVISEADVEPGGPEMCVCPECGYEQEKERGVPCRSVPCPKCGADLIAKIEEGDLSEFDGTDEAVSDTGPSGYVPYGCFSFTDYDKYKQGEALKRKIEEVAGAFKSMVGNILNAYNFSDSLGYSKPASWSQRVEKLRSLVDEFGSVISSCEIEESGVFSETLSESEVMSGVTLVEGDLGEGASGPVIMEAVVIEPGWGNKRDNNYYPREVLRRDIAKFKGVKMYTTNHRASEKSVRTEVSEVLDVPVRWTETGAPVARIGVFNEDFAKNVRNRHALGTLGNLHCSILADGTVRSGFSEGDRTGKYVESIDSPVSIDWVTNAGAGGHAVTIVEGSEGSEEMAKVVDEERKDAAQPEEKAPVSESEEAVLSESEKGVETEPDSGTGGEEHPIKEGSAEPRRLSEAEVSEALGAVPLVDAAKEFVLSGSYETPEEVLSEAARVSQLVSKLLGAGEVTNMGATKTSDKETLSEEEYDKKMDDIFDRYSL